MERKATTTTINPQPTLDELARRVEQLLTTGRQRYQRLWAYYRNPMRFIGARDGGTSDRPYRQAQEWGLPPRITGYRSGCDVLTSLPIDEITRKEVVIENDIGWRVDLYERLYRRALRSTVVELDLNGDGEADTVRHLNVLQLQRV